MINNGIVAPTATPMTTTLHALDTELAAPAAAVPPVPLPVVCFALGEAYGALYVRRLAAGGPYLTFFAGQHGD